MESTDKGSKRTYCGDRVSRGQHSKNLSQKPKDSGLRERLKTRLRREEAFR